MTPYNETLLAQYAALRSELICLELEEEALKEKILADFEKHDVNNVVDPTFGSFTVGHRRTWKYSPVVEKLEEKVKLSKIKEQDKGIAKATEKEYLVYKPVK